MAGRIILGIANPALNANGNVDSGATLTFYANGTTTPQAVYTDSTLGTPLTNPLSPDAAGRFPEIWAPDASTYSVKWTPTGESPITYDGIKAVRGGATTFTSSNIPVASEVALTTNTAANITSISLAAGEWLVWGNVVFDPAGGTTTTTAQAWINTTSAAKPTLPGGGAYNDLRGISIVGGLLALPAGMLRLSLSGTQTVYLSALSTFTGSTSGAYGFIGARRIADYT